MCMLAMKRTNVFPILQSQRSGNSTLGILYDITINYLFCIIPDVVRVYGPAINDTIICLHIYLAWAK